MVTQVRIGSVADRQALVRLVARARQDGIRLFRDRSGRYFASSASRPGQLHYVTGYSCDCRGFVAHGRCKHHAALMTALGWVDGTPDPTPPAEISPVPSTCGECRGTGTVPATIATGPRSWAYTNETCSACHGVGTVRAAA